MASAREGVIMASASNFSAQVVAALASFDRRPIWVRCDAAGEDRLWSALRHALGKLHGMSFRFEQGDEPVVSDENVICYGARVAGPEPNQFYLPFYLPRPRVGDLAFLNLPWTSRDAQPHPVDPELFLQQLRCLSIERALEACDADLSHCITVATNNAIEAGTELPEESPSLEYEMPESCLNSFVFGEYLSRARRLHNVSSSVLKVGVFERKLSGASSCLVIGYVPDYNCVRDAVRDHVVKFFPALPPGSVVIQFRKVCVSDVDGQSQALFWSKFKDEKLLTIELQRLNGRGQIYKDMDDDLWIVTCDPQGSDIYTPVDDDDFTLMSLKERFVVSVTINQPADALNCVITRQHFDMKCEQNVSLDPLAVYLRARFTSSFSAQAKSILYGDAAIPILISTKEQDARRSISALLDGRQVNFQHVITSDEDLRKITLSRRRGRLVVVTSGDFDIARQFLKMPMPTPVLGKISVVILIELLNSVDVIEHIKDFRAFLRRQGIVLLDVFLMSPLLVEMFTGPLPKTAMTGRMMTPAIKPSMEDTRVLLLDWLKRGGAPANELLEFGAIPQLESYEFVKNKIRHTFTNITVTCICKIPLSKPFLGRGASTMLKSISYDFMNEAMVFWFQSPKLDISIEGDGIVEHTKWTDKPLVIIGDDTCSWGQLEKLADYVKARLHKSVTLVGIDECDGAIEISPFASDVDFDIIRDTFSAVIPHAKTALDFTAATEFDRHIVLLALAVVHGSQVHAHQLAERACDEAQRISQSAHSMLLQLAFLGAFAQPLRRGIPNHELLKHFESWDKMPSLAFLCIDIDDAEGFSKRDEPVCAIVHPFFARLILGYSAGIKWPGVEYRPPKGQFVTVARPSTAIVKAWTSLLAGLHNWLPHTHAIALVRHLLIDKVDNRADILSPFIQYVLAMGDRSDGVIMAICDISVKFRLAERPLFDTLLSQIQNSKRNRV